MTTEDDEVPLEKEELVIVDERTGLKIPVTRYRRGVLAVETRYYGSDNIRAFPSSDPRGRLERMRERLRDYLEERGLPSDRTPNWIRDPDGTWRVRTDADTLESTKPPFSLAAWIHRVKQLTEPLSQGRRAADLLWHLNLLLDRPGIDEHLWYFNQVMHHYFDFQVGGKINRMAIAGSKAVKARKAGPEARKARKLIVQGLVCSYAEDFWLRQPLYRNDASNTADRICDSVNEELGRRGLLPKSGHTLKKKTIADYIREGLCGKKLKTG